MVFSYCSDTDVAVVAKADSELSLWVHSIRTYPREERWVEYFESGLSTPSRGRGMVRERKLTAFKVKVTARFLPWQNMRKKIMVLY